MLAAAESVRVGIGGSYDSDSDTSLDNTKYNGFNLKGNTNNDFNLKGFLKDFNLKKKHDDSDDDSDDSDYSYGYDNNDQHDDKDGNNHNDKSSLFVSALIYNVQIHDSLL